MIEAISRKAEDKDFAFIFGGWRATMKPAFKFMPGGLYHEMISEKINRTMARSEAFVLCDPTDADLLYAALVFERRNNITIIHWAYTKSVYWRMGLMKQLCTERLPADGVNVIACNSPHFYERRSRTEDAAEPLILHLQRHHKMVFNPLITEHLDALESK